MTLKKKRTLFNTERTKIVTARRKNYRNYEPVTLAPVPSPTSYKFRRNKSTDDISSLAKISFPSAHSPNSWHITLF